MGRYTSGSIKRSQLQLDPIAFTRHWIQRAPETTTMKLRRVTQHHQVNLQTSEQYWASQNWAMAF
jgi:hypothetical protein